MKRSLAILAFLAAVASTAAFASDQYLCSVQSTATVSRSMADAGPPIGPGCPTSTGVPLSIQCDVCACVAAGNGVNFTAACQPDGGLDAVGAKVQANAVFDLGRSPGNVATLSCPGAGTSTCSIFAVIP